MLQFSNYYVVKIFFSYFRIILELLTSVFYVYFSHYYKCFITLFNFYRLVCLHCIFRKNQLEILVILHVLERIDYENPKKAGQDVRSVLESTLSSVLNCPIDEVQHSATTQKVCASISTISMRYQL